MSGRLLHAIGLIACCCVAIAAQAGGPLIIGGPAVGTRAAFGVDGQPFTWDPAKVPIQYRVDPGPMAAVGATAVVTNATGLQRLQGMFGVWQGVSTASISFSYAGPLLPAGSYTGGRVTTVTQFNDLMGSCDRGDQSPVIFDADGRLAKALGAEGAIAFATPCALDSQTGRISSGAVYLNGVFQDGVDAGSNYELTANQFDEVISHEIGHFVGLDHSQINLDMMTQGTHPCVDMDGLAGLPLMFPFLLCQARKDAGLPVLAPDDAAWLSALYPSSSYASSYGMIRGRIYFSEGASQIQGVNVIARAVDDPATPQDESRRVAVSAVSGYLFTANPGQSVTALLPDEHENNTNGSRTGSRNAQLIGYYEIPVPPGTYTVEVESIAAEFEAGSGVGPLNPPIPIPGSMFYNQGEYWNQEESAFDFPMQQDAITVRAGEKIDGIDVILNYPLPRFDRYEDSGSLLDSPLDSPLVSGRQVLA